MDVLCRILSFWGALVTDDRRGWLGKRDDFYYRVDITEMEYTWENFFIPSCQMMRFRINVVAN